MSKRIRGIYVMVAVMALVLPGCGGGGGSSNKAAPTAPVLEIQSRTATFVDSPVEGLTVRSGANNEFVSKTKADGTFEYIPGGPVTFSIGGMTLGTVEYSDLIGSGLATPLSLDGNTTDETSPKATNLLRMLQTLDADGEPSNGITISDKAAAAAQEVDFSLPIEVFEAHPRVGSVLSLVANAEGIAPRALVAAENARAHFKTTMAKRFEGAYKMWFGHPVDSTTVINQLSLDGTTVAIAGVTPSGRAMVSAVMDSEGNIEVSCRWSPMILPAAPAPTEVCMKLAVTRYSGQALHGTYKDLTSNETGTWDAAVDGPYFANLRDPKVATLQVSTPEKLSTGMISWSFTNTTSRPQTPTAIEVKGNFPDQYMVSGSCKVGTAVAPGRSCTVTATFAKASYCAQGNLQASVTSALGTGMGREATVAYVDCPSDK